MNSMRAQNLATLYTESIASNSRGENRQQLHDGEIWLDELSEQKPVVNSHLLQMK